MSNVGMSSAEIRRRFLAYFKKLHHTEITSGPLVPAGDATLLFTNAGMVQFKDVFLGREKRSYTRATTSQCCIRAGGKHNDLENVGYTARHHTFFEMLGNFSFGDYFKQDAIEFALNFLLDELKLPAEKLWITVFEKDDEAEAIWKDRWLKKVGKPLECLSRCGEKDNFWSMGDTGPCGPCTEIFYDHGPEIAGGPPGTPEEDGDRYTEIWNLVFMQYNRTADGQMHSLPKPSVDTGMGLERLSAVMQDVHNNYDTDLFQPLIKAIILLIPNRVEISTHITSTKVIADHIRSSAFLIAEGIYPSNEGRGYVLRRIIRRALRHGSKLGLPTPFFYRLVQPLMNIMGEAYPILFERKAFIEKILQQEEEQFAKTLNNGLAVLEESLEHIKNPIIPGDVVFKLYDTYGFPVDLTNDIAREKGFTLDVAGFEAFMQKQREMSQKASTFKADYSTSHSLDESSEFHGYEHLELTGKIQKIIEMASDSSDLRSSVGATGGRQNLAVGIILNHTPFYAESGGQIGDTGYFYVNNEPVFEVKDTQKIGDAIIHHGIYVGKGQEVLKAGESILAKVDAEKRLATRIHHSATHLLHSALREVLGTHVEQKGSIVTSEKTRFDFSHHAPMTTEQIEQTERWVNEKVLHNIPVDTAVLPFDQAREAGAMALFGEKYGDTVRVLTMGDFSKELCGGTHAERTGDIGLFKIISETGISAGVRRIEAVAGIATLHWIQHQMRLAQQSCDLLRCNTEQLPEKIEHALDTQRQTQKTLEQLQNQLSTHESNDLMNKAKVIAGIHVLVQCLNDIESKQLRTMMDTLKNRLNPAVIVLVSVKDDNIQIIAGLSKDCLGKVPDAKTLVQMIGEKGGGREDLAQGGTKKPADLMQRLDNVRQKLEESLLAS